MKIALISKACIVGSYQTKLEALAAHDDVDLRVIVPPYWRESGHTQLLERVHTAGYDLIVAPMAFNGQFHVHFYPTLAPILRRLHPDICHIDEEPYNLATFLALRAARRLGARCLFFTWQNLRRRYPWPFSALERYAYRQVRAAIAGNHEAVEVLRQKGYHGPVRVIPQFGVDPDLFAPPASRTSRPFTIGYAGRLVEQKGLSTLLEALPRLQGEWRLLLIGSGPLRSALEEQLRQLGLAERVAFQERVPSRQMPRYYGLMDVCVLPSLTRPNWKEQFGRVLIEAMACETPVVGSHSGEIPNVIGEAGLVFPEGDDVALAAILQRLLDSATLRQRLGNKGRQRVLARYTQAQIAAETVALYREMMDNSQAR